MQPNIRYWKELASFSYASYLEKGFGAVQIKENPKQQFSPADLDKYFQYVPFDADNDKLPPEMAEMVDDYDPEKEIILMIEDAKGEKVCLQLTAQKLGITPLEAYKESRGKFVPGLVYKLDKAIGDVQPGYYIFEREEKAMLIFSVMGMDEDEGDACRTDKTIKVHLDFRDYFAPTEMNVRAE